MNSAIKKIVLVVSVAVPLGLASCGPVYTGLEGLARMMPEDKVVKCPFCHKQIVDQDRKCPFCGRDVHFDLGSDEVDRETRRASEPPQR